MVLHTEFLDGASSNHDRRYDVFLSFRGVDTRLGFVDHLYKALNLANYETFLDDEKIETGLNLKPELECAIRASRASIVVLSKNYASSTWCLNELVLILEQQRNSNQIVIPIFFHVEPTDVRKQQSSFGDEMAKHKQRMEAETDVEKRSQWGQKLELWKKALVDVADLKGKDAKGRKETVFIEEIVKEVHHHLGLPLRSSLPLLIGMDYFIESITSWMIDGSSHTADILTVVGMGGIGKTSLATYVYRSHRHRFHTSSFIEDIGGKCAHDKFTGLLALQKQLCGDITKTSSIQVHDNFTYTSMIENAIAHKKVLIVLDDIDGVDQLHALLGKQGFYPGSKIIITTKDASLTKNYAPHPKVQPKLTKLLLKGLNSRASLQLLSNHAFKCKYPKRGYEAVSEKILAYCDGHPLALKVLGQSLQDLEVTEWEECIQGLKEETDSRIMKALQMSFVSMPSKKDQEMFKHIACFFVGMDRECTEIILKACGFQSQRGINYLIKRCLLSVGSDNTLMMHQLLQEMGRDVVRQESLHKPWERSRLWCHEDIVKALKRKKVMENLLGLTLDTRMIYKDKFHGSFELETDAFSNMDGLMLLQLNYVHLNGSYKNLPDELRWLCMHGFHLKSIPLDLRMENLVALDLSYSNIESFDMSFYSNPQQPRMRQQKFTGSCYKEKRLLGLLKILNLSFCEQLRNISGFLEVPALERLIVRKCIGLTEVCESIEHCVELVCIDLSYCNKLEKLPRNLDKLKKLETLSIDGCEIGEIPIEIRDMDSPKMPQGKNILINSQTSSSAIVEAIPRDLNFFVISLPCSLVSLFIGYNNLSTESFPTDFSGLSMLKNLTIDGNPIVSLPNCVRSLPRLEMLSINDCDMLTSIEHPPCVLRKLKVYSGRLDDKRSLLQRIVFDPEMSPLKLGLTYNSFAPSSFEIEGMVKIQPMACVEEKVLCSLGWTGSEFPNGMRLRTSKYLRGEEDSQIQMYYEFGIFSTIYGGIVMPNCISHVSFGPSISFTVPSSRNMLRGLNYCCVHTFQYHGSHEKLAVPSIKISNITRNRTWIYKHYIDGLVKVDGPHLIFLSDWMIGKNEMEGGDVVTITTKFESNRERKINRCGFSFVYDNGKKMKEEEDALGYYKSWSHIIGGDLDAFQTTPVEYKLDIRRLLRTDDERNLPLPDHVLEDDHCKEKDWPFFRAFSPRMSDIHGRRMIGKHESESKMSRKIERCG